MVIRVGRDDPAVERRRRQGQMIRKMRGVHGMSIAELAEAIGVTPGAVSQWECGRFTPRQHVQVAIARALQVPHSAIFGLDAEAAS